MVKQEIARGPRGRVLVTDTITKVAPEDAGSIVVCASHGGASSGEFALAVPLALVVFNDAGIGKDRAGVAALAMLQRRGVAAAAVSHHSARIGDSLDTWEHGMVSEVNDAARALGLAPGQPLKAALLALVAGAAPRFSAAG